MYALTLYQPWAYAITEQHLLNGPGAKDTENRTWPPPQHHLGTRLQIHAGRDIDGHAMLTRHSRAAARRLDDLGGRANFWDARGHLPSPTASPPHPTLALGAIIGSARLTGCHAAAPECCTSPWADRPDPTGRFTVYHWQLTDPRALPTPVACPGRQRLWRVRGRIRAQVLDQDPHANTP